MNNNFFYWIEPLKESLIKENQWSLMLDDYKDYNLNDYLIIAQEMLEKQYCYLFSNRLIYLQIINPNKLIKLPIGFIKNIVKLVINNVNIDIKYVKIIDFFSIEILYNKNINSIYIEYNIYPQYNNIIEYELINKTIKLIKNSII
jgi:hypothetical protein